MFGATFSYNVSMSETEDFLSEANVAILATVDSRARAHATPVWYLFEDGEIIINTGLNSQKHRNVEAHPDISLVIDRRTLPYYAVTARGRATIGPQMSEADRLRLAVRYLGEDIGRRYVEATAGEAAITIRLRPEKLIVFDARQRL